MKIAYNYNLNTYNKRNFQSAFCGKIPSNTKISQSIEQQRLKIINKYGLDKRYWLSRPQEMYKTILDKYYNAIRQSQKAYPFRVSCNPKINVITAISSNDIYVIHKGGWHYRLPIKRSCEPIANRISLNVYPENELIEKLDRLVSDSNGTIEYKTPDNIYSWNNRHDPITIYFRKPINKIDTENIVNLTKKHIRKTQNENLLGTKIADGVYQIGEPTEKEVIELIKKAERIKIDPKLIDCLKSTNPISGAGLYEINKKGEIIVRTTPATIQATKNFLKDLEGIINE